MFNLTMKAPSGNIGNVKAENLRHALNDGYQIEDTDQVFKMKAPSGNAGSVKGLNLQNALNDGYQFVKPSTEDHIAGFVGGAAKQIGRIADTALAAGHLASGGVAEGVSKLADTVGASNIASGFNKIADTGYTTAKDLWNNPKLEKMAEDTWETGQGHNEGVATAGTAGSFVPDLVTANLIGKGFSIISKTGVVAKMPWIQNLNKFLTTDITAKNAAIFAGAGAGSELAKSDDPNAGTIEKIGREVLGTMVGGLSVAAGMEAPVKALYKGFLTNEGRFIKKYGGKINEDVVASAKELGLPLTPNLVTDNTRAAFLVNNKLQSQFVDDAYKDVMNNINKNIIEALEDKVLDNLGSYTPGNSGESAGKIISKEAKDQIALNKEKWSKQSRELYSYAESLGTKEDVFIPELTIKEFEKYAANLSYGSKGLNTEKRQVKDAFDEFLTLVRNDAKTADSVRSLDPLEKIKSLILNSEKTSGQEIKTLSAQELADLKNKVAVSGNTSEYKGISIRELVGWKQDFNTIAAKAEGYEKLYGSIAEKVEQDINNYIKSGKGNKEFVQAWREATNFNRDYIQNIIKTDTVRNILKEELPTEAVKYMTTPYAVKQVEKALNNDVLIGRLKRAAFEQQLANRNIINVKGDLNINQFQKLLSKDQDLVVSLIGERNYKTIQDKFMPYLDQVNKTGLKNTSGTSYVSRDEALQAASENLISSSLWGATSGGIAGTIAGGAAAGITGAAAGTVAGGTKGVLARKQISAIKTLSKMSVDPQLINKIINQGRKPASSILENTKSIAKDGAILAYPTAQAFSNPWPGFGSSSDQKKASPKTNQNLRDFTNPFVSPKEMQRIREKYQGKK